jgi:hypothetical protein
MTSASLDTPAVELFNIPCYAPDRFEAPQIVDQTPGEPNADGTDLCAIRTALVRPDLHPLIEEIWVLSADRRQALTADDANVLYVTDLIALIAALTARHDDGDPHVTHIAQSLANWRAESQPRTDYSTSHCKAVCVMTLPLLQRSSHTVARAAEAVASHGTVLVDGPRLLHRREHATVDPVGETAILQWRKFEWGSVTGCYDRLIHNPRRAKSLITRRARRQDVPTMDPAEGKANEVALQKWQHHLTKRRSIQGADLWRLSNHMQSYIRYLLSDALRPHGYDGLAWKLHPGCNQSRLADMRLILNFTVLAGTLEKGMGRKPRSYMAASARDPKALASVWVEELPYLRIAVEAAAVPPTLVANRKKGATFEERETWEAFRRWVRVHCQILGITPAACRRLRDVKYPRFAARYGACCDEAKCRLRWARRT